MTRRFGFPKTDEERRQTHQFLYGETELPPRGTGLVRSNELRPLAPQKTEEERRATHQLVYGETDLPTRGTGLVRATPVAQTKGLTNVITPNKIVIISTANAMVVSMAGYALTQKLREENIGVSKLAFIGIGSGCIAGLTSFLITRFIGSAES